MSVDFLNPFLRAAKSVLSSEIGANVNRGAVTLENAAYTPQDVTVLLSVIGDIHGVVLYSMDIGMALAMISKMLGEEQVEFDELAQSGVAEMGNVITGIVTTYLAEAGYHCSISVPTLIIGKGTSLSTLGFKRMVIPLTTNIGHMSIHVALREGSSPGITHPHGRRM